ncbi:MAG: Regulator of RpoS [Turneriella sp.]|nr:Regulator of RpoS [Turneriella sp.]
MKAAPFKNLKVLVVDDEAPLLNLLKTNLLTMGYSVAATESAEVALKKVAETNFNVLVSDIRLGKMDGLEMGKKMREKDAALAMVFITGKPNVNGMASAQSLGAVQYIAKPVGASDLGENVAIAARWNIAQLINLAAEKYFSIREGRLSILDNKFQRVKAMVKNEVLKTKDASSLSTLAYARNPQSTELFSVLDQKMAPYLRIE